MATIHKAMQECAPNCVDEQSDLGTTPVRLWEAPLCAQQAAARREHAFRHVALEQAKMLGGLPYCDGGDRFGIRDVHPYSAIRAVHVRRVLEHAGNGGKHPGAIRTLNADDLDQRTFLTRLNFEV